MKITVVLLPVLTMMLRGIRSEPQGPSYLPPNGGSGGAPGPIGAVPRPSNNGHPDEWAGDPVNYEFSYEVQDPDAGLDFGHREMRKDDEATGSYHVLLPDGRHLYVDYIADAGGYRPMIRYEGTATYPAPGPRPQQPGPVIGGPLPESEGYKY